jgi:hypothetical protein
VFEGEGKMVDRPVIGQIARTDAFSQSKIEVIGELTQVEWDEFFECIKECAAPYGGRIAVRKQTYRVPITILRRLPRKKKRRSR